MSSWFSRAFGYGLGRSVGRALFGGLAEDGPKAPGGPIKQQTEAEILADEKRYAEDERKLDEADRATKASAK
jgi:hypothetical protein